MSVIQPRETKSSIIIALCLVFLCAASGLTIGLLASGARFNVGFGTSNTSSVQNVALSVVPDKFAPTQDAFILAGSPNDNTIHVKVGQPVNFTITTDDNAQNMNFTGNAGLPFTVLAYNSTGTALVSTNYSAQQGSGMVVAHTFKTSLFNIPLPPISVVTFSYTFTKAGTYSYYCTVPCGAGMNIRGYMSGEIVVQ